MLLRDWLDENNFTQDDFAQRIGVKRETVSHWCRGRCRPAPRRISKIKAVTQGKVTLDDLQAAWERAQCAAAETKTVAANWNTKS